VPSIIIEACGREGTNASDWEIGNKTSVTTRAQDSQIWLTASEDTLACMSLLLRERIYTYYSSQKAVGPVISDDYSANRTYWETLYVLFINLTPFISAEQF
jgi:hypothetical protein